MRSARTAVRSCLAFCLASAISAGLARGQDFFDDFEAYTPGPAIGQGSWEGWDATAAADAEISTEQSYSGANSLLLLTGTDVVSQFDITSGLWEISTQMYVPSDHTGASFFIVMNTYDHGGPYNWSVTLKVENGMLVSDGGSGGGGGVSIPALLDEWVEISITVDLDANSHIIMYGETFVVEAPWHSGGAAAIGAIDLYSAGASPVWYDDVAVTEIGAPVYEDSFDAYETGTTIVGQGDWTDWNNGGTSDGDVVSTVANSPPNSLALRTDSDLVQVLEGLDGGLWEISASIYIPEDHTGQTWFILLNTYSHGGAQDWSTQVIFENGQVTSSGGSGFGGSGSAPATLGEWVELRIVADLDANTQLIYYGDDLLDETPWYSSGMASIQAIDIYSAGGSVAYIDDIVIREPTADLRASRSIALDAACPDLGAADVTVMQPLAPDADGEDTVTVTETILGPISAADVTAEGATVTDVLPTGVTELGTGTFISAWLTLGPFTQTGSAAPAAEVMELDYLTDGTISEAEIMPMEGDTIATDYEVAASTGLASACALNPGGVPTWSAFVDSNDTFDFNTELYFADINDVMVYAVSYITLAEDVDASICAGSDDSIQVLIDGVSVHTNPAARGYGAAGQCVDLVDIGILPAGQHTVMVKVFEGGGGHGFRLGFQETTTGAPITGMTVCLDPAQELCDLAPIGAEVVWSDVSRDALAAGLTYSLDLGAISEDTVTFSGDAGGEFIWGTGDVTSITGCLDATDPCTGAIREFNWAGVGPFPNPLPCGEDVEGIGCNFIGPSRIECVYPSIGDELDFDPAFAYSTGYTGPVSEGGLPVWTVVDDGSENGVIDYNVAFADEDNVMSYLVTYVENITDSDLELSMCFGRDDGGQVWLDGELLHATPACGGVAECTDSFPATLSPGIHALKVAAFDSAGGWGSTISFRMASGLPVTDASGLLAFLGPDLPEGWTLPACPEFVNTPPTAVIAAEVVEVPLEGGMAEVMVDGSASTDGDCGTQSLAYSWAISDGPDGVTFGSPEEAMTTVMFTDDGVYTIELTVDDGAESSSSTSETVIVTVLPPAGTAFVRGDADSANGINLTDGVVILSFLFTGGTPPTCMDAGDADDSGTLDITDGIYIFNWLFLGGSVPPSPTPTTAGYGPEDCDLDPTDDELGCETTSATCL